MNKELRQSRPLILGLGGGLGPGTHSLSALKEALKAAEKGGATTDLINLKEVDLPLFNPESRISDYPPNVKDYIERVIAADGYIWTTPAYHGTVSGVVKNALDYTEYLSDRSPPYLYGKPVGLICTAGGTTAGVSTIQSLIHVAHALRAWVVPLTVPIPQAGRIINAAGEIGDPLIRERLSMLANELLGFLSKR